MKAILCIILGVLFTFCFAPYDYFILGFVSFTGMLMILDRTYSGKRAFLYGWLFGLGHHITGLYWISYSMLVEPDKFAWMIPFSVTTIPAILALFTAIPFWLTYRFRFRNISRILFFGAIWTLCEMARGHILTGFPWNLTGYTWLSHISLAQAASYVGVYGMSLMAVIVFCSPHFAVRYIKDIHHAPVYKYCLSLYYLMPVILVINLLATWGNARIERLGLKFDKTNIRIVQPNIPQKEKFDPLRVGDHLFKYYTLSLQDNERPDFAPDLIIWPEVATILNIEEEKNFLSEVADIVPFSSYLILGSMRHEGWMINRKIFNSVQVIDSEGVLQRVHYDKHHLVPFGEYVPLREYLPGVEKITQGIGDFDKGSGPKTLKLDNSTPFSPLICYEIIFPGKIVDRYSMERPRWILNLTNDAWFGNTSGPYQHLNAARMRAIEEGLPVIRSANTGISAVIDGFGRVLASVPLEKEGIIDTKLPSANDELTFFSKYGNQIPLLMSAMLAILSLSLKYLSRALSKGPQEHL